MPSPPHKLGVSSTVFLLLNKSVGSGIFSIPSSIYLLAGRSIPASLFLWLLGGILAYCGFCVYLDFGLKIPKSGAEKNYLLRVYRNPKFLAVALFSVYSICLGVSSGNCFAFATYVLLALGCTDPNPWIARTIALLILSAVCLVHAFFPVFGKRLFNVFGVAKVLVLLGIAFSGAAVLVGWWVPISDAITHTPNSTTPSPNFTTPSTNFTTPSPNFITPTTTTTTPSPNFTPSPHTYAIALLRIFYSYRGWENGNFVLSEIHKPQHTLRIAGPIAISLVTALYLLCNASYFAVIPSDRLASSGTIVAGSFFRVLFNKTPLSPFADSVLPLLIALSNLGNVIVVTYGHGHMNLELAKNGLIPKWFAKSWPTEVVIDGVRAESDYIDTKEPTQHTKLILSKQTQYDVFQSGVETDVEINTSNIDIETNIDTDPTTDTDPTHSPTPTTGLFLHWIASALTLILPPPGKVYDFIIDLSAYPGAIIAVLVALGLARLKLVPSEEWPRAPYSAPWLALITYLAVNILLVVLPLIPQENIDGQMPYWAVPAATTVVLAVGLVYWKLWFR